MNNFSAIGRIGSDPRLNHTQDGTPVLGFRLAVDAGYGQNKSTLWLDGSLFGKRAESLALYINKGDQIGINGELSTETWVDKNQQERQTLRCWLSDVTLISNKSGDETQHEPTSDNTTNAGTSAAAQTGDTFEDEKIPF